MVTVNYYILLHSFLILLRVKSMLLRSVDILSISRFVLCRFSPISKSWKAITPNETEVIIPNR